MKDSSDYQGQLRGMWSSGRLALAFTFLLGALVSSGHAAVTVYDNLSTAATAGYSEAATNSPIFGDTLNLSDGGTLASVEFSLFNSTSGGNTGAILAGTMVVSFFDNTVPYAGGAITGALLGTANLNVDFTSSGGLLPGFYVTSIFDISSLAINVPAQILITQQFTQTSGTSTRNGIVLFGNPTVGSSPNTIYLKSSSTPEGLYTFSGNPGQVGYRLEIIPEPASGVLMVLAGMVIASRRRRSVC